MEYSIKKLLAIRALGAAGVLSATGARAASDACLQGFVWREASSVDHVCGTPQTRAETRAENAAALSRINTNGGAFGKFTCLRGFVWREAFNGDTVCVTPETRAQAAADNGQAARRVVPQTGHPVRIVSCVNALD
jgi:hypothetical protein